jgi:DNA replication and repair protein RecF
MMISSLRTALFRNLADTELDTVGKDIFLVGGNGQGKTNFLEALYFCCYASSFRGVQDGELPRTGEKDCSAAIKMTGSVYEKILVKLEKGRKTVFLDGKKIDDRKELLSVAPCIVFCHEDMEFVSGSPERRRWFFDQTRSLHDPLYLEDLQQYRRVLKTRNSILKAGPGADLSLLDALDPQMASYGFSLMEKREEAARQFSRIFAPLYEEVSGIPGIGVRYVPSWKGENAGVIGEHLARKREGDLSMGFSLSGPHRDRYVFVRENTEFTGKASTGQRRLLALLLRIAQARCFSEKTGKKSLLLLDDVLLELDPEKRRRLLTVLPVYDQAFYTFLPEEPYERYRKTGTLVYRVQEGNLLPY